MFNLNGNIEKGVGLGSDLGFPTLNIKLEGLKNKHTPLSLRRTYPSDSRCALLRRTYPSDSLRSYACISIMRMYKHGIYVVEIKLNDSIYKGVMHFGSKGFGTDDFEKIFCEVHVFDFNQDIDSGQVSIKVLKKIRDVREFKSTDELVAQVNKDIDIAKQFFKDV